MWVLVLVAAAVAAPADLADMQRFLAHRPSIASPQPASSQPASPTTSLRLESTQFYLEEPVHPGQPAAHVLPSFSSTYVDSALFANVSAGPANVSTLLWSALRDGRLPDSMVIPSPRPDCSHADKWLSLSAQHSSLLELGFGAVSLCASAKFRDMTIATLLPPHALEAHLKLEATGFGRHALAAVVSPSTLETLIAKLANSPQSFFGTLVISSLDFLLEEFLPLEVESLVARAMSLFQVTFLLHSAASRTFLAHWPSAAKFLERCKQGKDFGIEYDFEVTLEPKAPKAPADCIARVRTTLSLRRPDVDACVRATQLVEVLNQKNLTKGASISACHLNLTVTNSSIHLFEVFTPRQEDPVFSIVQQAPAGIHLSLLDFFDWSKSSRVQIATALLNTRYNSTFQAFQCNTSQSLKFTTEWSCGLWFVGKTIVPSLISCGEQLLFGNAWTSDSDLLARDDLLEFRTAVRAQRVPTRKAVLANSSLPSDLRVAERQFSELWPTIHAEFSKELESMRASIFFYGQKLGLIATKFSKRYPHLAAVTMLPASVDDAYLEDHEKLLVATKAATHVVVRQDLTLDLSTTLSSLPEMRVFQMIGVEVFSSVAALCEDFRVHLGQVLSMAMTTVLEVPKPSVLQALEQRWCASTESDRIVTPGFIHAALRSAGIIEADIREFHSNLEFHYLRIDLRRAEREVAFDCSDQPATLSIVNGYPKLFPQNPQHKAHSSLSLSSHFSLSFLRSLNLRPPDIRVFLSLLFELSDSDFVCPMQVTWSLGALRVRLPTSSIVEELLPAEQAIWDTIETELTEPFSFLDLGSGSGSISRKIASRFSKSSVVSLESNITLAQEHWSAYSTQSASPHNNIVCSTNQLASIVLKLFQSPEFFRYQVSFFPRSFRYHQLSFSLRSMITVFVASVVCVFLLLLFASAHELAEAARIFEPWLWRGLQQSGGSQTVPWSLSGHRSHHIRSGSFSTNDLARRVMVVPKPCRRLVEELKGLILEKRPPIASIPNG
eukprot:m.504020 g.504020  ORF g.504020 m.504020 type:complete len:1006 (-) comp57352_c0_seq1:1047-4064(-)